MRTPALALVLVAGTAGAADPPAKLDRYGDPLPPGALMRLGTVRNRAPISSFGIMKDGTVVTVGSDRLVRTWAPGRDRPAAGVRVGPSSGGFDNSRLSADGRLVAVYDYPAKTIRVWDWQAVPPKEVAAFAADWIGLNLLSPDGSKLLGSVHTSDVDNGSQYLLCDIATGKTTAIGVYKEYPHALAFSGDGKRLVTAADELMVRVRDTADGKQIASWKPDRWVRGLAVNADGSVIATAPDVYPAAVGFFDALTGKPVKGLTGPTGVGSVAFSADGKSLYLYNRDGVRVWDPRAGKLVREYKGRAHSWTPYLAGHPTPRLTPDGKTLVATSGGALLRWDAATGELLFPETTAAGHVLDACALGASPDGKLYATGGYDDAVWLWDAATGTPLRSVTSSFHSQIHFLDSPNVEFSADSKHVFCPSTDQITVAKWAVATGKEVRRFAYRNGTPELVSLYAYGLTADGKTVLASGMPDAFRLPPVVVVWDADTGAVRSQTVAEEPAQLSPPFCSFGPDGKHYYGGGELYALDDLSKPLRLKAAGRLAAFSPDGRRGIWLAADPKGKWTASVVELKDGATVSTIPSDSDWVRVALSADGSALAVLSRKGVAFHDVRTGKEFGRHAADLPGPRAARFTPDGKRLLTAHDDTAPLVWEVPVRPTK